MPIPRIDKIRNQKSEISSKEILPNSETYKRAVVRSLEIIGEASKSLGRDFQAKWSEVEWREMSLMRNILIHVYFGINYEIVWDVFVNKIPELLEKVNEIIESESEE
ncbi:MAG: HepT-like ribonuclease domain-containing protein [Bacteroidota bacterium]